ncbi:MAG: LolA family protein [Planctomycetota bacterium]|jgi:outer membrane lipoprotein-sorting protein
MKKTTIFRALFALGLCAAGCVASLAPAAASPEKRALEVDPVDAILEQLNRKTREIETFECQIENKYIQVLLESHATRKGTLYYMRSEGKSALRVNFTTLQQEDEKERPAVEQYILLDGSWLKHASYKFEGIWLVHIDYEMQEVKYYQVTEPTDPNKSGDVFDLVSNYLPMPGFTRTEELKKQFEVKLIEKENAAETDFTQVRLKVKPNSVYKDDDFLSIDFWIDKKVGLPVKFRAVKTEPEPPDGDVVEIRLLKPRVNKGVDKKVFEFKIPDGFGEPEIKPLPKKGKQGQDGSGNSDR